ncbi:hypothetical protein BJ508DRAFT_47750 [Ascobolus immersus RN42]|uniref:Uncharacterized protein n=1 Tax=Ascobolus immersus RN42 TaxID=1160509 RepID=A0A3N4IHD1_ASCIM|nr:hypothetical protein BJ508DRAFT_47750 [Ascobolus immersus RN42]
MALNTTNRRLLSPSPTPGAEPPSKIITRRKHSRNRQSPIHSASDANGQRKRPAKPTGSYNYPQKAARAAETRAILLAHIRSTLPQLASVVCTIAEATLLPTADLGYSWEFKDGYEFPQQLLHHRMRVYVKPLTRFSDRQHRELRLALKDGRLKAVPIQRRRITYGESEELCNAQNDEVLPKDATPPEENNIGTTSTPPTERIDEGFVGAEKHTGTNYDEESELSDLTDLAELSDLDPPKRNAKRKQRRDYAPRAARASESRLLLLDHIQMTLPQLTSIRSVSDVSLRPPKKKGYFWQFDNGYAFPQYYRQEAQASFIKQLQEFSKAEHEEMHLALACGELRAVLTQPDETAGIYHPTPPAQDLDKELPEMDVVGSVDENGGEGSDISDFIDVSDHSELEHYGDSDIDEDYTLPPSPSTKRRRHSTAEATDTLDETSPRKRRFLDIGSDLATETKQLLLQHILISFPYLSNLTTDDIILTPETRAPALPYCWKLSNDYTFPLSSNGARLKRIGHFSAQEHVALREALEDGRLIAVLRNQGLARDSMEERKMEPVTLAATIRAVDCQQGHTPVSTEPLEQGSRSLFARSTPIGHWNRSAQRTSERPVSLNNTRKLREARKEELASSSPPNDQDALIQELLKELDQTKADLEEERERARILSMDLAELSEPMEKGVIRRPLYFGIGYRPLMMSTKLRKDGVVEFGFRSGDRTTQRTVRLERVGRQHSDSEDDSEEVSEDE